MPKRMASGARTVCAALASLLLGPASAHAVTFQSWPTSARLSSANRTLVAAPNPPAPAGPDASTGILAADGALLVPPGPLDAVAIAISDLSKGIIAAGAAFTGSARAPADNRLFDLFGGAAAT